MHFHFFPGKIKALIYIKLNWHTVTSVIHDGIVSPLILLISLSRDVLAELSFHWTFKVWNANKSLNFFPTITSTTMHHKQLTRTRSPLIDLDTDCQLSFMSRLQFKVCVWNVTTFPLEGNLIYLCLNGLYIKYCLMRLWPTLIHRGEETLQVMNNSVHEKATFQSMRWPNEMATRLWTYWLSGRRVIGFGIQIQLLINRGKVILHNLAFIKILCN